MPAELLVKRNQAGDCFVIGWLGTVAVYNTNPPQLRFKRDFGRAIRCAELYLRSNILALTFDDNPGEVIIWDDRQEQEACRLLPPRLPMDYDKTFGPVLALHFRQSYLLVIGENSTAIYETEQWQLLYLLPKAVHNPHGLGDIVFLAHPEPHFLLLTPGELAPTGQGQLHLFRIPRQDVRLTTLKEFSAHQTPVTMAVISPDGHFLATASERGTVIRLWSLPNVHLQTEFQRGLEVTHITSCYFQTNSYGTLTTPRLAIASTTGTVHLYPLNLSPSPSAPESAGSSAKINMSAALTDSPPARPLSSTATHKSTSHKSWWSRLSSNKLLKEVQAILPKYFANIGSQLQIATGSGGQIIALTAEELVVISPKGYYQKYGYKIDSHHMTENTYWPIESVQLS